jgi:hypothetical protein
VYVSESCLHKEIANIPSFCGQIFPIDWVWPDALNDLENLVSDVELVIELAACTRALALDVELHECMK